MNGLDAGMIFVAVLALVILLVLVIFTWIKWRRNEIRKAVEEAFSRENGASIPRITEPAQEENGGFVNIAAKMKSMESMTGSRTILTEQGIKTGDVVYNTSLNDPRVFRSSDVVFHSDGPSMHTEQENRDRSKTWL